MWRSSSSAWIFIHGGRAVIRKGKSVGWAITTGTPIPRHGIVTCSRRVMTSEAERSTRSFLRRALNRSSGVGYHAGWTRFVNMMTCLSDTPNGGRRFGSVSTTTIGPFGS